MATFDLNNFVIDHVLRGLMVSSSTGEVMWSINQITEPQLSITTESADAVDALGSKIASFYRSKNAEFTGTNSLFDLGLYAAQNGTTKAVASTDAKLTVPAFETLTVGSTNTEVILKHTPKTAPTAVYLLKGDGTLGEKISYSSTAGTGKFTYDSTAQKITLPDSAKAGEQYFVNYEYDAERAVSVTGDAINFPKAGKFYMEVLGTDVCNQTDLIHAFVVFPNAKLKADVDVSFTTDGTHPFTIEANQSYCDNQKTLFQIIVPDEE